MLLHHIFSMHLNCIQKCLIEFEFVMYILKHHTCVHVMLLYRKGLVPVDWQQRFYVEIAAAS